MPALSVVAAVLLSAVAAPGLSQPRSAWNHQNTPDNLQRLMEAVHRKLHVEKAAGDGAALFRSVIPDEARVKRALRDDVPPAVVQTILANYTKISTAADADLAALMRPAQSVVRVHGATTEEIALYRDGSIPFEHFPSATQNVAKQYLRPGVTFYEVEFLEPGQPRGIKYHLFYWDGARWSMLGPVWRTVQ